MRAATGGAAWSDISQISAYGKATVAGLGGTARFDDDLIAGRYARRFHITVMGSTAEVYDGATLWAQDISGGVHPYDSPYAREQALTAAYLVHRGYLNKDSTATFACQATRVDDGRTVTVIRVTPRGGSSAELAIDAQTHLLASVTRRTPLEISVVRYADYRTTDGLVLPFSISSGTKTSPADDYAFLVTRYELQRRVGHSDFAKPIPPNDARMVGDAQSSTVPMALEWRQLIVWASIDGKPSMPFILDTGGHAIVTTLAAKTLGLRASGAGESGGSGSGTISTAYTRVRSVRIGQAELLDQPFLVIPYPYSFYERGEKTPLAGIIGLEFFERFAVRLDYGDRTVTFAPLAAYRHRGNGSAIPFTFESDPDEPMVDAAADEHSGLFGVDTGNAGDLILFGDFLNRTGLAARYAGGVATIGRGTGGTNTGHLEKLRSFTIGDRALRDVETDFTQMKSGAFSAWSQAGNMGFIILSRFIPTFDYADRRLYLDSAARATPFAKNRSGIGFEKNEASAFDVLLVRPNTAGSAAGIVARDRIVAVNAKRAAQYSGADLFDILSQPAGTVVRLRILHAGNARDVTLVLR
ncbi:MAG: aspartyl protease family protein [Candidatus Cybelea sp.]